MDKKPKAKLAGVKDNRKPASVKLIPSMIMAN